MLINLQEECQKIVDLLTKLLNVPAVVIMKLETSKIKVFKTNKADNNPYHEGDLLDLEGTFCEELIKNRKKLIISNVLKEKGNYKIDQQNPEWLSYLGYPIYGSDQSIYGTICIFDRKEQIFNSTVEEIVLEFKKLIESHLRTIYLNSQLEEKLADLEKEKEKSREKENALQLALEGASAGLWNWDLETGKIFYTRKVENQEEEILTQDEGLWKNSIHPDDYQRVLTVLDKHLQGNIPYYEVEYRVKSRDNKWKWTYDIGKVINRNKEGKALFASGIFFNINQRKAVEQELSQQENRYKELFNNISSGVIIYEVKPKDQDIIVKDINASGAKLDEIQREDIIGKSIFDIYPHLRGTSFPDCLIKVWESGEPHRVPLSYDRALKCYRRNYIYKLPSGELVSIFDDLTEKELTRLELFQTRQELKIIFESIGEGIIVSDVRGRVVFMNKAAEELTAWDEDAIGRDLKEVFYIVNENTNEVLENPVEKVLQTGSIQGLANHTILVARDGAKRAIADSAAPVRTEEGVIKGVVIVFRDETTARQMRQRILESEEKYRALFENTGTASCIIEKDSTISLVNKEMEKLIGYDKPEIEGQMKLNSILSQEERIKELITEYEQTVGADYNLLTNKYELELSTKQGSKKNIINAISLIPGTEQFISSFIDISELKRVEKELQLTIHSLNSMVEKTIDALGSTIGARDAYTSGHQEKVAKLSLAIAQQLGLSDNQCKGIYLSALIHDIGKINIPISILTKPTRLTGIEFELIKTHPDAGYEILHTIEFPWPIAKIVRQHHERINGSGYPDGLVDEEISLEAKIIAVADVVEAMTSHRPYRPALGLQKALTEIIEYKGMLYDEEIVQACQLIFQEEPQFLTETKK